MTHLITTRAAPWTAPLTRWAERSQQRACRNAMVASTALAQARLERDEVAAYVVGTLARRSGSVEPAAQREAATGS
ncbi:hypothetical protein [Nocardioides marmoraquaticus]